MTAPVAADPTSAAAVRAPLGDIAVSTERFTEARVDRIIDIVIALGCAVLGVQSFLNELAWHGERPEWHPFLLVAVFGSLGIMIVALSVGTLTRLASGVFAVVFLAALVCWPAATTGIPVEPDVQPWIWYLLNVGTAAAVAAFRLPLQIVWAVAVPIVYAVARLLQLRAGAGGRIDPERIGGVVLDAVFAMILAGVIVTLGWMLRTVAVGIDRARADAVSSYAAAAAAAAAETERVAVAALMHDSVLAALIAAERAATPREETLAVAMAREALTRLANAEQDAGEGSDEPVAAASVVTGIDQAAAELGVAAAVVARISPDALPVPGRVARAVVLAATQAIANAVQHAGGRGLRVEVTADAGTLGVVVQDAGGGFAPADVPADRLGIRGSIVARMAAAGGHARVRTGSSGTTVRLDWERPE